MLHNMGEERAFCSQFGLDMKQTKRVVEQMVASLSGAKTLPELEIR